MTIASPLIATALLVPAAMAITNSTTSNTSDELVVNGGFEQGTTGWRTNLPSQSLRVVSPGAVGSYAVQASNSVRGNVIVNDQTNTVRGTSAQQQYLVSAMVRSSGTTKVSGAVSVREYNVGTTVSQDQQAFYVGPTWQRMDLTYTAAKSGSDLDLNILAWNVPVGTSLLVDDVHLRISGPFSTSPPPTTTQTTTTQPTSTKPTTTSTTQPTTTTTTTTTPPTTTTDDHDDQSRPRTTRPRRRHRRRRQPQRRRRRVAVSPTRWASRARKGTSGLVGRRYAELT